MVPLNGSLLYALRWQFTRVREKPIGVSPSGLPVVLLKILQTGVLLEGIGNLYSIQLHSFL